MVTEVSPRDPENSAEIAAEALPLVAGGYAVFERLGPN